MFISQKGLEIEGVSDGYINGDIEFSSSHIEQVPLIFTHNWSLNQSLYDSVSLEVVNGKFSIRREAFNCLHSEIFYSLYPNPFVDHNLHINIHDFQVKTSLWSYFSVMQSDKKVTYKNEGNVAIPFNSFQYYEEENDLSMNILYETHANLSTLSDVVENNNMAFNLERDEIIFYAISNTDDTSL